MNNMCNMGTQYLFLDNMVRKLYIFVWHDCKCSLVLYTQFKILVGTPNSSFVNHTSYFVPWTNAFTKKRGRKLKINKYCVPILHHCAVIIRMILGLSSSLRSRL